MEENMINEYTIEDLKKFDRKQVIIDCGDSIWTPFGGAELVGKLMVRQEDVIFYTELESWCLKPHQILDIEEAL